VLIPGQLDLSNISSVYTSTGVFPAHVERHWLKEVAPSNISPISNALEGSHVSIGWLNEIAVANILDKFVT
jgi:hypothetical protein